jgi:hypothetical protein
VNGVRLFSLSVRDVAVSNGIGEREWVEVLTE